MSLTFSELIRPIGMAAQFRYCFSSPSDGRMIADCFDLIVNVLSGGGGRREGWRRFAGNHPCFLLRGQRS